MRGFRPSCSGLATVTARGPAVPSRVEDCLQRPCLPLQVQAEIARQPGGAKACSLPLDRLEPEARRPGLHNLQVEYRDHVRRRGGRTLG